MAIVFELLFNGPLRTDLNKHDDDDDDDDDDRGLFLSPSKNLVG